MKTLSHFRPSLLSDESRIIHLGEKIKNHERAWSKTDYYQIFQDNTRTEISSSFVCDWFRSERMSPSIVSGMCIYWYPKRNQIQPFGTKFNRPSCCDEKDFMSARVGAIVFSPIPYIPRVPGSYFSVCSVLCLSTISPGPFIGPVEIRGKKNKKKYFFSPSCLLGGWIWFQRVEFGSV